jgi:hypothetical protein
MSFSAGEIVGIALGGAGMLLVWVTALVQCCRYCNDTTTTTKDNGVEAPAAAVGRPFIRHQTPLGSART